jgi:hypothetical protein
MCLSCFSFLVIFEAFSWQISCGGFETLLSPKSCVNPWSESGDRELDLRELTRVRYSSRAAKVRSV